jgi:hypothetical protein
LKNKKKGIEEKKREFGGHTVILNDKSRQHYYFIEVEIR